MVRAPRPEPGLSGSRLIHREGQLEKIDRGADEVALRSVDPDHPDGGNTTPSSSNRSPAAASFRSSTVPLDSPGIRDDKGPEVPVSSGIRPEQGLRRPRAFDSGSISRETRCDGLLEGGDGRRDRLFHRAEESFGERSSLYRHAHRCAPSVEGRRVDPQLLGRRPQSFLLGRQHPAPWSNAAEFG